MRQLAAVWLGLFIITASFAQDSKNTNHTAGVLTQEARATMTADDVLASLKAGNKRFVDGKQTNRDYVAQRRIAAGGQYPKAAILSCLDSRIPVEAVFDAGIGDLFVARVAGNFENVDILGSMEFACIHARNKDNQPDGVRLIVVMGHVSCGAIGHAIDRTRAANIAEMLENIEPAIRPFAGAEGKQSSSNRELMDLVTMKNIEVTIADIRRRSDLMTNMEKLGQIKIVGALYDLETGEVKFCETTDQGICNINNK